MTLLHTTHAPVQEVFSSTQGEGPFIGLRQLFVRFAHCHLKCAYCDTPMHTPTGEAHFAPLPDEVSHTSLELDRTLHANPISMHLVFEHLKTIHQALPHHSVSFTGGEPLLYHKALSVLMPEVQQLGMKTYLETSASQPEFLSNVLHACDILAADIKLPSATQEPALFQAHQETLRLAYPVIPTIFVKLIFNDHTSEEEMRLAQEVLLKAASTRTQAYETPIILQPETALDAPFRLKASQQTMFQHQALWLKAGFKEVRVIPQTHKVLAVR
ncbi:MAG: 7-carboxy-7-deazaguanine synthase QueE [Vampirovibrionales bacterium]